MKKISLLIFMAGLVSLFCSCKESREVEEEINEKFEVGQIWSYDTRKGEENSTLLILKIEEYEKDGVVIHLYVDGLNIPNPDIEGGISKDVGHLPLSEEAVLKSVNSLVSENNTLTDYQDGYNSWKKAYDSNTGGIFTVSLKETIQYLEEAMTNPR